MSNRLYNINGVICPECKTPNKVFLFKPRKLESGKRRLDHVMCDKCFKDFKISTWLQYVKETGQEMVKWELVKG